MKYKIKITDSEYINTQIQQKLFDLGFGWSESGNKLTNILDKLYIYIYHC